MPAKKRVVLLQNLPPDVTGVWQFQIFSPNLQLPYFSLITFKELRAIFPFYSNIVLLLVDNTKINDPLFAFIYSSWCCYWRIFTLYWSMLSGGWVWNFLTDRSTLSSIHAKSCDFLIKFCTCWTPKSTPMPTRSQTPKSSSFSSPCP